MTAGATIRHQPRTSGPALWGRPIGEWVGMVARLVLGGVLLVAGALKIGSPLVSARAVQAYQIFPFDVAAYLGYALPVIEIIVGLLLVVGLFTRAAAMIGTVLMLAFVAGIGSAWARGLNIDCGCFGGGGQIGQSETTYGVDIARDLGLTALGAWLVWRPRSAFALDTRFEGAALSRAEQHN